LLASCTSSHKDHLIPLGIGGASKLDATLVLRCRPVLTCGYCC
jgi:hypothetical protein